MVREFVLEIFELTCGIFWIFSNQDKLGKTSELMIFIRNKMPKGLKIV